MAPHRAAVLALVAALMAPPSLAQDFDVPVPSTGKTKSKGGKRRTSSKKATAKKSAPSEDELDVPTVPVPKPATAQKPAPSEDELDVPTVPASKPATAKKPVPALEEEEIPSIGGKTELLVKLSGGIKGARMMLDNKDVGSLPLSGPMAVEPGEHTLVVRRPGYAEFSRRVTAQKGKPTEVSVTLEAVAGVVSVTSDVSGATVSINGQDKGPAPLSGLVLKPGTYEIVFTKPGYQPDTKNLNVRAGKDYTVVGTLRPAETQPVASSDAPKNPVLTPTPPAVATGPTIPLKQEPEVSTSQPWFKRWYVWAGAAVVAAAATGAVVATQGGSTALTKERVCGGPCDGSINGIRAGAR